MFLFQSSWVQEEEPAVFNAPIIPSPGTFKVRGADVAARFAEYKGSFLNYIQANGWTKMSDERKICIFKNICGPDLHLKISEILTDDFEITLEQLLDSLDDYFSPKNNLLRDRFFFSIRKQKFDENFDKFYVELEKMAKRCQFGQFEEDMIKVQLIKSVHMSKQIRFLNSLNNVSLAEARTELRHYFNSDEHITKRKSEMSRPSFDRANSENQLINRSANDVVQRCDRFSNRRSKGSTNDSNTENGANLSSKRHSLDSRKRSRRLGRAENMSASVTRSVTTIHNHVTGGENARSAAAADLDQTSMNSHEQTSSMAVQSVISSRNESENENSSIAVQRIISRSNESVNESSIHLPERSSGMPQINISGSGNTVHLIEPQTETPQSDSSNPNYANTFIGDVLRLFGVPRI